MATVELSDKAKILSKTDVSGASKQVQDAIKEALDPVAATKGIKALEEVADQTIILSRAVKESVLEHDTRISRAGQRLDVLEKRLAEVEEAHQLASSKMEANRLEAERKFKTMVDEANLWETKLDARLKVNTDDVNSKLLETAETFKRCDAILGEIKAMRNTAEHHVGGGIPAATGPASLGHGATVKSLLEAQSQHDLLRKRVDEMQATLNSWNGLQNAVREVQDVGLNQVAMQLSFQEQSVELEGVTAWVHAENTKLDKLMRDGEARSRALLQQTSTWLQQGIMHYSCK